MKKPYLVTLVLLLATFATYWQCLEFDFVYDDLVAIVHNQLVANAATTSIVSIITQPFFTYYSPGILYRPITTLTYLLNSHFFTLNPFYFHLVNILLHFLNATLIFHLTKRLLSCPQSAFIISLLFAIHPLNTEAVANIVGRAELLALLFTLLSLLLIDRKWHFAATLCLSSLAMLSKESALCLTLLATIIFGVKRSLPTYLAALCTLSLRGYILKDNFFVHYPSDVYVAANPLLHVDFTNRVFPALKILGQYLSLSILPLQQSADYSMSETYFWSTVFSLNSILYVALLFIFGLLGYLSRKEKYALGVAWFFVGFLLTANLVTPIGTIMGERLSYLPAIGVFTFIVASLANSKIPSLFKTAMTICYALFLYSTATKRIEVWRNNSELFANTVVDSPYSPKAHFNYALTLFTAGDLQLAEKHFRDAFAIMPNNIESAKYLLEISLRKGELGRAEYWCTKVLELNPSDMEVKQKLDELAKIKIKNS